MCVVCYYVCVMCDVLYVVICYVCVLCVIFHVCVVCVICHVCVCVSRVLSVWKWGVYTLDVRVHGRGCCRRAQFGMDLDEPAPRYDIQNAMRYNLFCCYVIPSLVCGCHFFFKNLKLVDI